MGCPTSSAERRRTASRSPRRQRSRGWSGRTDSTRRRPRCTRAAWARRTTDTGELSPAYSLKTLFPFFFFLLISQSRDMLTVTTCPPICCCFFLPPRSNKSHAPSLGSMGSGGGVGSPGGKKPERRLRSSPRNSEPETQTQGAGTRALSRALSHTL